MDNPYCYVLCHNLPGSSWFFRNPKNKKPRKRNVIEVLSVHPTGFEPANDKDDYKKHEIKHLLFSILLSTTIETYCFLLINFYSLIL